MARVLVVEDETAVRTFVARALTHTGHDVATACDGLDGLAQITGSPFDLMVTDIVMPGLDGIELALKVAKEQPETAILLMSGYAMERQRAHNLEALVHRVIAKPFSLQQICEAVDDALGRGALEQRRP